MAAVPGNIDADRSPPMAVPLRHFVVALGFLLAGAVVIAGETLGVLGAGGTIARVHLVFAGWVCITIMGAMTQFVPVWSGATLYSRRLAALQLWLVAAGLAGFTTAALAGRFALLAAGGAVVLVGFWIFAYNVGRTLVTVRPWDVTERHFAYALGFFVLVTPLGLTLAADFAAAVYPIGPVSHADVHLAHATLAVFGIVLTTIFGALYQLATMFTQTELEGIDRPLQRFETAVYPIGVLALAVGRLLSMGVLARVGGFLVAASALGVGVVLLRRLRATRVAWTPMLRRYAVAAVAILAWALAALVAWLLDPLAAASLYGAPGTGNLFALGVVGFVVLGTVYHIVPFIVWVHRYSDRLGLEDVPMIDDLYSDRLAAIDGAFLLAGTVALAAGDLLELPAVVRVGGGAALVVGVFVFVANVLSVLHRHSPHGIAGVLFGRFGDGTAEGPA